MDAGKKWWAESLEMGMGMSVFLKQDFANIMASGFVLRGLGGGLGHEDKKLLGSYIEYGD